MRARRLLFPHLPPPILFAHRGVSARAPENTLSAFELVKNEHIPGVELDVHLAASGEIVVAHDADLRRVAGVDARIAQTAYSEIRRHSAGNWGRWEGSSFAHERIPTLEAVFDLLGDEVVYDIEIKTAFGAGRDLIRRLAALVRRLGLDEAVMVSSFNPFAVAGFRRVAPHIPTAVIYSGDRGVPRMLRGGQGRHIARCTVLKPHHGLVGGAAMARLGLRYPIVPWTVNQAADAALLKKAGVAGIISDDPRALEDPQPDRGAI